MLIYKLFALLFIPATPLVGHLIVSFFGLRRHFNLIWTDAAIPLWVIELVIVSRKFFGNSFLPHYILVMAILAIMVAIHGLQNSKKYTKKPYFYGQFFKNFYRVGFFVTGFCYLVTVGAILFLK